MKVYDCFIFYNEFELLELRLKSLWNVVDCFVLVEADKTHAGKSKPYYFWERQDDFREFFPKIRHLPVEMTVPLAGTGDWSIENAQRDAIIYGLEDTAPDDLIFISDLDEFPAPDILQRIRDDKAYVTFDFFLPEYGGKEPRTVKCVSLTATADLLEGEPLVMEQKHFSYYFDCMSDSLWHGTVLVKRKNLTTPQEMRDLRHRLPQCVGGGWHFSYMGGVDRVRDKMTSIVDGNELVVQSGGKFTDLAHVTKTLASGDDLYDREDFPTFHPCDAHTINLPLLDEFLRKYPHFLREPQKYFGGEFI